MRAVLLSLLTALLAADAAPLFQPLKVGIVGAFLDYPGYEADSNGYLGLSVRSLTTSR